MEELLWRKTLLPPAPRKKRQIPGFSQMQRIGRSLMLPIASLPVAALLMRFGSADVLGADGLAKHASWMQPVADVLAGAGGAIFDNLPLIFALGVAVGYAKKADGSTALAALVAISPSPVQVPRTRPKEACCTPSLRISRRRPESSITASSAASSSVLSRPKCTRNTAVPSCQRT
ncbi:PTS system [Cutibacterium acnes JCM 18916]|nr:PTS system [Cutibacterium acnes JCM 18916]